jgi:hypothetical protein
MASREAGALGQPLWLAGFERASPSPSDRRREEGAGEGLWTGLDAASTAIPVAMLTWVVVMPNLSASPTGGSTRAAGVLGDAPGIGQNASFRVDMRDT